MEQKTFEPKKPESKNSDPVGMFHIIKEIDNNEVEHPYKYIGKGYVNLSFKIDFLLSLKEEDSHLRYRWKR
ncbi:hypothetical protein [Deferribacter desulfuricans]|nr:hypothetical protein [Deferribacter desulfuricans]